MSKLDSFANLASSTGSGRTAIAVPSGGKGRNLEWIALDVAEQNQLVDVLSWAANNQVYVIRGRPERHQRRLSANLDQFGGLSSDGDEDIQVVFLNLSGLNRIIEYTPEDMVISVESGISLAALDDLTVNHGQWLPVHLWDMSQHLADVVDAGDGGFLETACGGVRSLVLGMSVATTAGESIKTGGKVVKNVTGYDLGKLFIGSRGWLGIPHRFHLRLFARPVTRRCFIVDSKTPGELIELSAKLASTGLPLSCLELVDSRALFEYLQEESGGTAGTTGDTDGDQTGTASGPLGGRDAGKVMRELLASITLERDTAFMLIGIDGHEKVVEEVASEIGLVTIGAGHELREIASALGSDLFALAAEPIASVSGDGSVQVELSVSLRDMKYLLESWWTEVDQPVWHARPMVGRLWLRAGSFAVVERWLENLRELCAGLGHGFTIAFSTPRYGYKVLRIEHSKDGATSTDSALIDGQWAGSRIQEALKNKFDPSNILNPLVRY